MIINMNGGGGASLSRLKVTVSATQPSNPIPADLWAESSTAATYLELTSDISKCTTTTEGAVAIVYTAANSSNAWASLLKKNELLYQPLKCYQRISSKWVSLNAYMYGGIGSWVQFSSVFKAYIAVTWPSGSTCAILNGSTRLVAPNTSGSYTFTVPNTGDWVVSCTDGTNISSSTVSITAEGQSKSVTLSYNTIPQFTYTGTCTIVNDSDSTISTSTGNWNIKFYTSGTLTITDLAGAANGIDIFLVGGGGGGGTTRRDNRWAAGYGACGGGGGYTKTYSAVQIAKGSYAITVGAGGSTDGSGGASKFGSYTASGGSPGTQNNGGNGGSGGGAGAWSKRNGYAGGTNGASGTASSETGGGTAMNGGTGQGTTTKTFGNASSGSGDLAYVYSQGGGGGGGWDNASPSTYYSQGANGNRGGHSGDGGKGGNATSNSTTGATAGSAGFVIIRNAR